METDVYGSHDISNVSDNVTICDTVQKCFPWLGLFEGKFSSVEKTKSGKVFTIHYEDNTSEHWYIEGFADYGCKARIPIGGIVFRYVQTFRGSMGYFSATVVEILDRDKWVCKLCDGESNNYTLSEIEIFSIIQVHTNDEHTSTRSDDDWGYDDDRDEEFNLKSDTSTSDSASSDVEEEGGGFLDAPMG